MLNFLTTLLAVVQLMYKASVDPNAPDGSARAENLRKEEMRSCGQTRLSDDGLVSLVALGSSHGSNVAPNEARGPTNVAQVTTNYFPP